MLSIPKYPEQYAQHFPAIFYLLCCASQHHVRVTNRDHNADRAGHQSASNDAPLAVHTEFHEPSEQCSGYDPSFEGLRGAVENLE